jgi:uncharacterized membrane protein
MDKHDNLIRSALDAEDRALLAAHAEPGYFAQAIGLFHGRLGWVMWVSYLFGMAAFAFSIYALWRTWQLDDPVSAIRWAVLTILAFQGTVIMKLFLGSHLEANRMLREIKRVELQVALLRAPTQD